jgi:8-oxo-dGTP pyrophosphatase MutT (NUDIX family)
METLWSGNHFDVVSLGDENWEAVHENDMVLMLPLLDGEYIIRKEYCPSYNVKDDEGHDKFWTPISGTVENGEHPVETLKREMGEETPVLPQKIRIIEQIKQIPFVKVSTQRVSFYHFEVLDYSKTNAEGDGSNVEERSDYQFVDHDELQTLSTRPNADFLLTYMAKTAALEHM